MYIVKNKLLLFLYFVGRHHPDITLGLRIYMITRKILMNKEDINKIDIRQKKNLNQNIRVKEGKIC